MIELSSDVLRSASTLKLLSTSGRATAPSVGFTGSPKRLSQIISSTARFSLLIAPLKTEPILSIFVGVGIGILAAGPNHFTVPTALPPGPSVGPTPPSEHPPIIARRPRHPR